MFLSVQAVICSSVLIGCPQFLPICTRNITTEAFAMCIVYSISKIANATLLKEIQKMYENHSCLHRDTSPIFHSDMLFPHISFCPDTKKLPSIIIFNSMQFDSFIC